MRPVHTQSGKNRVGRISEIPFVKQKEKRVSRISGIPFVKQKEKRVRRISGIPFVKQKEKSGEPLKPRCAQLRAH